MKKLNFIAMSCNRCYENYSMLSKFTFGNDMSSIVNEYGAICPKCLTGEEKDMILLAQYNAIMESINRYGGAGAGVGVEIMQNLARYLSDTE